MRGIRDDFAKYQEAGVTVLGTSPDPVQKLEQFKSVENLPFDLLSDEGHKIAEKYGVWVEKSMYGRKYWGIERTSFLIDAEGRIEKIFRKVKPKTHNAQVLAAIFNS